MCTMCLPPPPTPTRLLPHTGICVSHGTLMCVSHGTLMCVSHGTLDSESCDVSSGGHGTRRSES